MKIEIIKLENNAIIYKFGEPKLFIMAGIHGEEMAPIKALQETIDDYKKGNYEFHNTWVLPCLNIKGYKENNRFYYDANLNGEFKDSTDIYFMYELTSILKKYNIEIFVDLHEDVDAQADYMWSTFKNDSGIDNKVREFCKQINIGLIYQPPVKFYEGSSGSFAEKLSNIKATYTTETMQYAPINDRIKRNKEYIQFFKSLI